MISERLINTQLSLLYQKWVPQDDESGESGSQDAISEHELIQMVEYDDIKSNLDEKSISDDPLILIPSHKVRLLPPSCVMCCDGFAICVF